MTVELHSFSFSDFEASSHVARFDTPSAEQKSPDPSLVEDSRASEVGVASATSELDITAPDRPETIKVGADLDVVNDDSSVDHKNRSMLVCRVSVSVFCSDARPLLCPMDRMEKPTTLVKRGSANPDAVNASLGVVEAAASADGLARGNQSRSTVPPAPRALMLRVGAGWGEEGLVTVVENE